MLRIITLNLNGIRAAWRKGLLSWARLQQADVVCLQELRADPADLSAEMRSPDGLHAFYRHAERKGYSGVGLWSRQRPRAIVDSLGHAEFDAEGRYLRADFGSLSVVSLYQPSGSSSEHRQRIKFRFMDWIYPHLAELAASGREVIVGADWNIAHQEVDLRNWKSNQKNSGFLPEERAWIGRLLAEAGWCDVYRRLYPEVTDESYTWWSNRGQAWARNIGWRLDYQLATPGIAARARRAIVYRERRFSDHAPLTIDYEYAIDGEHERQERPPAVDDPGRH
ncbi:exodeoxyribonuclease III [Accumulibacter sp.]|uniref:exodeoxyribonuclease III n=1 Tax=Accumulibacter sp. TaxID=2053492 RepID=UPI0025FE873D|nr:exodeoxyribonuclease III [Accumulibacter sp.]MCM8596058.1 exodeoxyribonuclease III [Accumulibacter sp.]MCM8627041.1 exodeoxyribonuclease III [Accumulibacter sp.]MDS4050207.1 exodeoxyribonuclease III [Accumulibacter sp.]